MQQYVMPRALVTRVKQARTYVLSRFERGPEASKAAAYWGGLTDYHLSNDTDPHAIERSEWLADEVVPMLRVRSLLEIGTNSGRNLIHIRRKNPDLDLKGIDVNPRAISYARAKGTDIEFAVADANDWTEPPDRWDAALTMSVLDHIPGGATELLAEHIARSARHIIAVELWDGEHGSRSVYKYSRDGRALFERHGFKTLRWERAPGQYDEERSLLWCYIGSR